MNPAVLIGLLSRLFTIIWPEFIASVFIFFIISTLPSGYYIRKKQKEWAVVQENLTTRNRWLFYLSSYGIIYLCFVLYNWYEIGNGLPPIFRYIMGVLIFAGIALIFPIASYLLHLFDQKAYLIGTDILNYINEKQKRLIKSKKKTKSIEGEIKKIKKVKEHLDNLDDNSSIAYAGNDETLEKRLIANYQLASRCRICSLKIGQSENYIITEIHSGFRDAPDTYTNYYLSNGTRLQIYEGYKSSCLAERTTTLQHIRKYVSDSIERREEIDLPALQNSLLCLPLDIFIQVYLLEIFGVKSGYITPITFRARMIFLVFGIYKFLLFGTFISILIK